MRKGIFFLLLFFAAGSVLPADSEFEEAAKQMSERQKTEIGSYLLSDSASSKLPSSNFSVEFYNQAVQFYQKNEKDLAREALKESLQYDPRNFFAWELLGDLEDLENKTEEAKKNYVEAYKLKPSPRLRQKIKKMGEETAVGKKLSTYGEEHFIIKYSKTDQLYDGFELREILRLTYQEISKDFGEYLKNKIVVLLYDDQDFKRLTDLPPWVAGLYDGKIRVPINRTGIEALRAIVRHEMTHAFISVLGAGRTPAWVNEGLAVFEENKVMNRGDVVFRSAVKTGKLFPLDQLMSDKAVYSIRDPLLLNLFYEQSYEVVRYLIERYGMFRVKQIIAEFANGKNPEEAVRAVLKISIPKLEREWKESFTNRIKS